MPTLFRFLIALLVLAALAGGGLLALIQFVEPTPREMTVNVPAERLQRR